MMSVQLFGSPVSLQISYKEVLEEDQKQVQEICDRVGLACPISIFQPAGSAELNSQNFILRLSSDKQVLLRRCKRLQGKSNYEVLNKVLTVLKVRDVHVPELYFLPNGDFPYLEMGQKRKWAGYFLNTFNANPTFQDPFMSLKKQPTKLVRCMLS